MLGQSSHLERWLSPVFGPLVSGLNSASSVLVSKQEWSRVKEGQATVGKLLTSSLDPFPPPSLAYSPSLSSSQDWPPNS